MGDSILSFVLAGCILNSSVSQMVFITNNSKKYILHYDPGHTYIQIIVFTLTIYNVHQDFLSYGNVFHDPLSRFQCPQFTKLFSINMHLTG